MNKTFLAIVAATIVNNIIGFFWYSSSAFGPTWAQLAGIDFTGEMPVEPIYYGLALSFFVAGMLAFIIKELKLKNSESAARMAFIGWLAFLVPYGLQACIYSGLAPMLFAINAGYNLVSLVAMAAVIIFVKQR